MFEDLPEPKFVVQDKSIKKMSNKITPNKNLERRIAKKIKDKYNKQQQKEQKKKKT